MTPISRTTDSTSETSLPFNNTLCYTLVRDCEEALANSQCRCYTDRRSALPHARIREHGLTLLNMSMVDHLCLSFCGIKPIGTQNLALLRTLRIHNAAPEVPFPIQEISISPAAGLTVEFKALSFDFSSSIHVTILDTAALNGLSTLKTYSIVGPTDSLCRTFSLLLSTSYKLLFKGQVCSTALLMMHRNKSI
uniref:Uncharacterized protein n=1 Tax=Anabas testudineus TaxID=64144 RepID=A0AAQ6ICI6_ANATE